MAGKILVTGATGKVGSQVTEQLAANKAQVRATVRPTSNLDSLRRVGAESIVVDLAKAETLGPAFEGVEKIFLATPVVPNDVEITEGLIAEAKRAGVKHVVRLSVTGVDAEPGMIFTRKHREIEKIIKESGIPFTFVRPTFFMQNFLELPTIKSQGAFFQPTGDGKASYVDTRDIAAVATAALTEDGHEGKSYEVTGPEALSAYDVAEILSSVTGRKITFVDASEEDTRAGLKAGGVPDWLVEALLELNRWQRDGFAEAVLPGVEQATGRMPISFEQFVRDHIEAFK